MSKDELKKEYEIMSKHIESRDDLFEWFWSKLEDNTQGLIARTKAYEEIFNDFQLKIKQKDLVMKHYVRMACELQSKSK